MDNQSLLISKANFVQFRKDSIYNHYDFHPKELGRGAYGIVYKAKQKQSPGQFKAIKKIIKKSIRNPNSIKNQIQNLAKLDHPTIIKIYEIFEDSQNLYLVTDLCQGGELFDKLENLGSFSENDAKKIFDQLLQGINYCHKQHVVHRDVKPQNILFLDSEGLNLKLIDFGLSFKFQNSLRQQLFQKKDNKMVGTSYYIAPQVIEGNYDQRCDIWSAGIILYILVTAIPPFDGQTDKQIIQCIKRRAYSFDIPEMKNISRQCQDLISKILLPEFQRLTIEQIYNHPWMKSQVPNQPLKLNFKKLSEFGKFSKLKKITANFIASKLSEKQVERLGALFKQIDTNHDGSISIEQLKAALQSQKQIKSYQQLKQIMQAIDTDKNGQINYTQFIASSVEESKIFTKQNLARFFKTIDKDGNGTVDKNELRQVLQKNNFDLINGKQLDEIMNEYDKNHDGTIDFNQFFNAMTR